MAEEIQVVLDEDKRGMFYLEHGDKVVAEMVFSIDKNIMTVYHTEVAESLKGQGIASLLLDKMEKYARENNLLIKALCPYVGLQFRRQEERFRDLKV